MINISKILDGRPERSFTRITSEEENNIKINFNWVRRAQIRCRLRAHLNTAVILRVGTGQKSF
jgi:hypothetical protein